MKWKKKAARWYNKVTMPQRGKGKSGMVLWVRVHCDLEMHGQICYGIREPSTPTGPYPLSFNNERDQLASWIWNQIDSNIRIINFFVGNLNTRMDD